MVVISFRHNEHDFESNSETYSQFVYFMDLVGISKEEEIVYPKF